MTVLSPMRSALGTGVEQVPGASAADRRDVRNGDAARPLRLLVFTSLYPNAVEPRHGIFVEERLRKLVAAGRVTARVVAPVPWFPFRSARFGRYAGYARVPVREERWGISIEHPRYPVIPKIGMDVAPALMYRALLPVLRKQLAKGRNFDVMDAHYFYPDGVAAARLGRALHKPVVISARGSDVNVVTRHRLPCRQIRWAAARAAAIVTVSRALKERLVTLGVDADRITTLRNGVDLDRFSPMQRAGIRTRLELTGPTWLTVGNLIELKGVHLAIEALVQVPGATLLVAGDGPEGPRLRALAARLGVAGRVRFLGAVRHDRLCDYYNAADALMLASSREGMPNAALEAIACGTPVVAAPFEGVAEVVSVPEEGEIADARSAEALVAAWVRLRARGPTRAATRRFAEQRLGWAPVVDAQGALYARVAAATT